MANNQNTYTIVTYDSQGYASVIVDANLIKYSTAAPGGFKNISFSVSRNVERNYDDLAVGLMVRCYNTWGQVVWEGMLTNIERYQKSSTNSAINVAGIGYATLIATKQETLIPAGGAAGDISSFVRQNINPLVSSGYFKAANIFDTGVNIQYSNALTLLKGNAKTTVRNFLDKMLLYGNSNNDFMNWAIWDDRTFWWQKRPASYTLIGATTDADDVSIEYTNNQLYSSVEITYISKDTLKPTLFVQSASSSQNFNYTSFDALPGQNATPLAITAVQKVDFTRQGPIGQGQVQQAALSLVKQLSLIKVISNDIKFARANTIQDALTGGYINLGSVRAGNIMLVPDLTNTDWTFMQNFGFTNIGNSFYIAETEYDVDTNTLTVKPEQGRDYARVIERILSGVQVIDGTDSSN